MGEITGRRLIALKRTVEGELLVPADLTPTEFPLGGGLTVGEIAVERGTAKLRLLANSNMLPGKGVEERST